MAGRQFERPAPAFFGAIVLAAMVAAFAIGQARAQFVNPVPPTSPTLNPSTPNIVTPPPPPVAPVSPTAPAGLPGSSTVPGSQVVVPPPSVKPETTTTRAAERSEPRIHVRHRASAGAHWSRRHSRFWARRVLGPSYYPGLGEVYPPYVNPCHFRPTFYVYYGVYPSYACAW